ncbi:hypothetical protein [Dermacoccus nishinomiyaensis]|uniref:hypothetical protein n=1 Tax=Dermacoccus nishinomiyaensis TaxID=1274 RepID=UPI0033A69886
MDQDSGFDRLDALLTQTHRQLGTLVYDSVMGQGGPPEPVDPDRALGLLLAAAHRQTRDAVVRRTARQLKEDVIRSKRAAPGVAAPSGGTLMRRPATIRLKYREQALRIAHAYWPRDLDELIRRALEEIAELIVHLEAESLPEGLPAILTRVSAEMGQVLTLPKSSQLSPAPAGYDYLEAVEQQLSTRASRLVVEARNSRVLLDTELIPHLSDGDVSWLGALEVAQDLADDLDLAHREALSLLGAVASVKEAGTDFRAADLQTMDLTGLPLVGIRWDQETIWPPAWEERILRASSATDDDLGGLVVGPQPHDSTVGVDA